MASACEGRLWFIPTHKVVHRPLPLMPDSILRQVSEELTFVCTTVPPFSFQGQKPATVTTCIRLYLIQVGLLQSSRAHTNIRLGVGGWSVCRCNDPLYVSLSQKDVAQRSWQGSNRPGPPRPTAYCVPSQGPVWWISSGLGLLLACRQACRCFIVEGLRGNS